MKLLFHNRKTHSRRAQAMVEFAIVAPILFLMLLGIFEVGRMIFLYAAVTNASREAVRYGSAVGYDEDNELKYRHCSKIRQVARLASYFLTIPDANITISYDHGPGTAVFNTCPAGTDVASGYFVKSGDRIIVTVSGQYTPFTSLIPWGARPFTATSARTILGYVNVGPTATLLSGPTGTATSTMDPYNPWTDTPTATITNTPTDTPTATLTPQGDIFTFTPIPTNTITNTPTITPTRTPSLTPTLTFTATNTFTPTSTPTAVPGCDQIKGGSILLQGTSMTMTIQNPHNPVTVSTIHVVWNAVSGGPGKKTLNLLSAFLGTTFWSGTNSGGDLIITPSTTVTIPGNNTISNIIFNFDKNYVNASGNESISITLSTAGCEGITIKNTK